MAHGAAVLRQDERSDCNGPTMIGDRVDSARKGEAPPDGRRRRSITVIFARSEREPRAPVRDAVLARLNLVAPRLRELRRLRVPGRQSLGGCRSARTAHLAGRASGRRRPLLSSAVMRGGSSPAEGRTGEVASGTLRPRDPTGHLLDERDRVDQPPLPAHGQGPRALPDRAGRTQVPLPSHPLARPDRQGSSEMGEALGNQP
jgi:hypothetical protein